MIHFARTLASPARHQNKGYYATLTGWTSASHMRASAGGSSGLAAVAAPPALVAAYEETNYLAWRRCLPAAPFPVLAAAPAAAAPPRPPPAPAAPGASCFSVTQSSEPSAAGGGIRSKLEVAPGAYGWLPPTRGSARLESFNRRCSPAGRKRRCTLHPHLLPARNVVPEALGSPPPWSPAGPKMHAGGLTRSCWKKPFIQTLGDAPTAAHAPRGEPARSKKRGGPESSGNQDARHVDYDLSFPASGPSLPMQ